MPAELLVFLARAIAEFRLLPASTTDGRARSTLISWYVVGGDGAAGFAHVIWVLV